MGAPSFSGAIHEQAVVKAPAGNSRDSQPSIRRRGVHAPP